MRKTTIYTLLCTTMIISSSSLAAEDLNTPIKSKIKKLRDEVIKELPTTPQIEREVESKLRRDILSPDTANFYKSQAVGREKSKRDAQKEQKFFEISQTEFKERMVRASEHSEKQEQQQAREHQKLIEEAKKATALQHEVNENLMLEMSQLSIKIEGYETEVSILNKKYTLAKELGKENAEEMQAEITEKTKLLSETRGKLMKAQMKAENLQLELSVEKRAKEQLQQGLKEVASQGINLPEKEIKVPEKEIKVPEKEPESSEEEVVDTGL